MNVNTLTRTNAGYHWYASAEEHFFHPLRHCPIERVYFIGRTWSLAIAIVPVQCSLINTGPDINKIQGSG